MASPNQIKPMKVSKSISSRTGARAVDHKSPPRKSRSQSSPLMFVNITDPADSKRADNRQAIRKFVMIQHNHRQKSRLYPTDQEEEQSTGDPNPELLPEIQLAYNRESSTSENSLASGEASGVARNRPLPRTDDLLPGSPLNMPVSGQLDPFDTCPAKIDMRVHQLLDMFVNNEDFFPETKPFSRDVRRKIFFPLALSSKAAFHALIAISATAALDDRFQALVSSHHNYAVRELNRELENGQVLEDSTFYAVRGLLHTAMAMNNATAVQLHLQGMVAIIEKHGSPYNMKPLARKCVSFLAYWACEDGIDMLGTKRMTQFPFSAFIRHMPIEELEKDDVGLAFLELADASLLSKALLTVLQRFDGLSILSKKARENRLTRQEIQTLIIGICRGGQPLFGIKDYCMSPLEECCRNTTYIHFYADIVPFEDSDGPLIVRQTEKIQATLLKIDALALLNDWPNVCLWIALTSGAFAVDDHWTWFRIFLREACDRLKVKTWDDVASISNEFLRMSCDFFVQRCKGFWESSMALYIWVDSVLPMIDSHLENSPDRPIPFSLFANSSPSSH